MEGPAEPPNLGLETDPPWLPRRGHESGVFWPGGPSPGTGVFPKSQLPSYEPYHPSWPLLLLEAGLGVTDCSLH